MIEHVIKYQVEDNGDTISLLSITPHHIYVEHLFYEGVPLQNIYLNNNGVFELKVMHIFEEDTDHFALVSLTQVEN